MKLEAWLNLWPTIWAPTSLWSLEVVAYHIPTYFWLGGGDGWFWSCLADFSLFNFKILFFPGEHLKNRRAPSSNDLLFSGGHDKANQISQWSHPKILFLKSPKGSCVGPKDNQPFGAPEKVATWKGEQGSRLISNSWSLLYSNLSQDLKSDQKISQSVNLPIRKWNPPTTLIYFHQPFAYADAFRLQDIFRTRVRRVEEPGETAGNQR